MAADTTIKINPAYPSEVEFEVKIEGIDDNKPEVRFVVVSKSESCNYSITCSKVKGKEVMWMAKIPSLKHITEASCAFFVEVIVDGYYFKPAEGTVQLIKDPTVTFGSSDKKRPTVTTSFTVKQKVDEAPSPDITGQYAPTNQLLVPEFEPKQSDIKTGEQGNVLKRDKMIDTTRISDIGDVTVPGGTDHEPQSGADRPDADPLDVTPLGDELDVPDEDIDVVLQYADAVAADEDEPVHPVTEPFDARRVAESILKSTMGSHTKPTVPGSLFKRDGSGRPVVEGLDTPEQKAAKIANAAKVRNILKR